MIVRGDDHSTAVLAGIGHVTQLRIDRNGQWRRWQHRPVTTRTGDYWITQDTYGPAQGLSDTKVGTFTQALYDEAKKDGWTVISMKNDWKRIFAFDD